MPDAHATAAFGSTGSGLDSTGAGNYVLYEGTGTSVTVTGLAASTSYTFIVYEYNSASDCYLTTGDSSANATYCTYTEATAPEVCTGATTTITPTPVSYAQGTGGTQSSSGGYYINTFTNNGTTQTFTFTTTYAVSNAEALIVAGGGGGGGETGGGGGAGGLIHLTSLSLAANTYSVTVGAGGAGGAQGVSGSAGSNSIFLTDTAKGGGFGGTNSVAGGSGGSGGGTGANSAAAGGTAIGSTGNLTQGYSGGAGAGSPYYGAGGGGGADTAGTTGTTTVGGNGGKGLSFTTSGSSVYYAGGGGGGILTGGTAGSGGSGIGGNGTATSGANGGAGTANTGGGGGGSGDNSGSGGNGGSGIVIIKYQAPAVTGVWSSTNTAIDTVNSVTGVIYGIAAGTDTITYTASVGNCVNVQQWAITVNSTIPGAPTVTPANNGCTSTLTASNYTGTLLWNTGATTSSITVSTVGTFSVTQTVNACPSLSGTATAAPTVPAMQATIGAYTVTTASGTTVNWTNGTGDPVIVIGKLTATTGVNPTNDASYTANTAYGSGNTTGAGNYVLYEGTGTSVSVTGLSASTAYTFVVYEYNNANLCYLTTADSSSVTTVCSYAQTSSQSICAGGTTTLSAPAFVHATGGTFITSVSGYYINEFTSGGTFIPNSVSSAEVFLVGGGGGGGDDIGGGGGGGQVSDNTNYSITAGSYSVTIGAGGIGAPSGKDSLSGNGGSSIFGTLTAIGGGGGGSYWYSSGYPPSSGASGGGAGASCSYTGATGTAGHNGGNCGSSYSAGGGGGAGTAGSDNPGNGGNGVSSAILGTTYYWGAGGGGAGHNGANGGNGGEGGAGGGADYYTGSPTGPGSGDQTYGLNTGANGGGGNETAGGAAGANTGSGGGGGAYSVGAGGSGGCGIVIIKYPVQTYQTGGTWASSDTNVATVNSSGVVTAKSSGSTTITYSYTLNGTCNTVQATPVTVSSSGAAPTVTDVDGCTSTLTASNYTGALLWSNGATTSSIIVGVAGTYSVTQTVSGCLSPAGTATASPSGPAPPTVTDADHCGSSTLTASNYTGTLSWNTGATASSITVTAGSTYSVTQTVGSCTSPAGTATATPLTIPNPPTATDVDNCGSSTITASNYTGTLSWSNGATTSAITVTSGGSYTVTQTAGDGCTSSSASATAAPSSVPSMQATIGAFTYTTTSLTTVNWLRGNGDSVMVVGRLTTTGNVPPTSGTNYNANAAFGSTGSGFDSTGAGNYVLYKGTGTSVAVTGLAANTAYTFIVYEYDHTGPCYLTPGSSSAETTLCNYTTAASSSVCSGGTTTLSPLTFQPDSGGTITTSGGYYFHTFTSSGTFKAYNSVTAEVLVVGGGGGGGGGTGGGGGAGALIDSASFAITATSYSVTIGAGGSGGSGESVYGSNGTNSIFGSLTATGGNGGASNNGLNPTVSGSGGGGFSTAGQSACTSCTGKVNAGGASTGGGSWGCGGGGGAGHTGYTGTVNNGGNGGDGLQLTQFAGLISTSTSGWFAAGGGGGYYYGPTAGTGGSGIGGNGGASGDNGGKGSQYTGSGGGGALANSGAGGAGDSGVVIIKYPYPVGTWSSSNTAIDTVNASTGVVYGISAGTDTINFTYTLGSCIYTYAIPITVNAAPGAPTAADADNCGSSILTAGNYTGTLLWNTGATTSSVSVTTAGTYSVTQTVSGCTSPAGTATANPLLIPSTPVVTDVDNCNSTSLLYTSATGALEWNTGATTSSITVTSSGTYSVTQTAGDGCTSSSGTATAAPGSTPAAPTVTDADNCGSSTLTASAYTGTLSWNTGATTSSISVTTGGTYSVTQTVSGCTSSAGTATASPGSIPTTQSTIGAYTSTTSSTTTVNWTRGNGNNVIVVARLTSTTGVDPTSGSTYTANTVFGSGNTTGSGNYAVYTGTGTSVTVTGLSTGVSYTFTVYEYDNTGYCYLTPGSSSSVTTVATPTISLNDNSPQVSAANVGLGVSNLVLHQSSLTVTTASANLTGMTCTAGGSYASSDITDLKVYYSTSATFTVGTATLLSTLTNPGTAGTKTFSSFTSQTIPIGTEYIYITADIATGATLGNTINVSALSTSNFTFASGTVTGSTTAGGLQTFASPVYYNKSSGASALQTLSNWGLNTNGSGSAPSDFVTANQQFNITNGTNTTIGAAWTVSGSGSIVIVGDGTDTMTFTIPSSYAFLTAATNILNHAVIVNQNASVTSLGTCTVYGTYQHDVFGGTVPACTWQSPSGTCAILQAETGTIPSGLNQSFQNFTWDCNGGNAGSVNLNNAMNNVVINGDFKLRNMNAGYYLYLNQNGNSTLTVMGNLYIGTSDGIAGNAYLLLGDGTGTGTLNLYGNVTLTPDAGLQTGTTTAGNGIVNFYGNYNHTFNATSGTDVWFNKDNYGVDLYVNQGTLTVDSTMYISKVTVASGTTLNTGTRQLLAGIASNVTPGLTLQTGATLITSSTGGIYGNGSTGTLVGTTVLGNSSFASGVNYTFSGATTTAFPTTAQKSTFGTVANLTVNAAITLHRNITVSGTLALNSGTLTIGANTLTYSGANITVTSGSIDGSNGTATLAFTNTSALNLPANCFSANLNVLTMNGGGGVTLGSAATVAGTLNLTNGIIYATSSDILNITNPSTAAITGGSGTSCIQGPMTWMLQNNVSTGGTTYIYPVADGGGNYVPFQLVNVRTGSTDPVIKVTIAQTGASTYDGTLQSINPRNWRVDLLSGNFTSSAIGLTETSVATDRVAQSSAQSGTYTSIGNTSYGTIIVSNSGITIPGSNYTYFASGSGLTSINYTVKLFLQGYYLGGGNMSPLIKLLGISANATDVDTVVIQLWSNGSTMAYSASGILQSNGNVTVTFPSGASGNSYYLVIKHRNSLQTWSASAQTVSSGGSYDFTTGAGQAYSSNMINLGSGIYGIYSGDINQDNTVNTSDKSSLQSLLSSFLVGVYNANDVTGDGFVDEDDYRILENNVPLGLAVSHP